MVLTCGRFYGRPAPLTADEDVGRRSLAADKEAVEEEVCRRLLAADEEAADENVGPPGRRTTSAAAAIAAEEEVGLLLFV